MGVGLKLMFRVGIEEMTARCEGRKKLRCMWQWNDSKKGKLLGEQEMGLSSGLTLASEPVALTSIRIKM